MAGRSVRAFLFGAAAILAATALSACNSSSVPKHMRELPRSLVNLIEERGFEQRSPIFVRIFKEESELEIWKQMPNGQYALLKTYEICAWSGELGPKVAEGDRQAPEGFYTVSPGQMNPNSSYYLSFNIGYPNAYDRSLGRTGQHLMVHGACSSAGCYSMNDDQIAEIFGLAREAFTGGQRDFQVHAFPFRMTPDNLARHRDNANLPFWRMLKQGYDHFEVTRQVPEVDVCDRRYVFNANPGSARFDPVAACPAYTIPPAIATAVAAREAADEAQYTMIAARLDAPAATTAVAPAVAVAAAATATAPISVETTAAVGSGRATMARPDATAARAQPSLWDRVRARLDGNPATAGAAQPTPGAAAPPAAAEAGGVATGIPTPLPNPNRRAGSGPARAATNTAAYQPATPNPLSARMEDAFGTLLSAPVFSPAAVDAARQRAR